MTDTEHEEPEHGEWSDDETARWCWSCKQYLREDLWDDLHGEYHAPDWEPSEKDQLPTKLRAESDGNDRALGTEMDQEGER